ncbi:MAG: hypothetical protein M3Z14_04545 [Candidatus Eremiobacteraeota bacterium]|nr:hypothetical protein [Candidatus Eremiobacteraeota bacterium]
MQSSNDIGNLFSRSWQLLTSNWIIIIPGIIIGLLAGVLGALIAAPGSQLVYDPFGNPSAVVNGNPLALVSGPVISIIATILAITYTTGMAGAAWRTGTTTMGDGKTALERDAGNVLVAMMGMLVLGIVAGVLAPFTLGLSLLAYAVFFLYTMAAAVVGGHPGVQALKESVLIARHSLITTLIVVLLIGLIAVVTGLFSASLSFMPFLGPVVAGIIEQIVVAFVTLVIVGEYLRLRAPGSVTSSTPTAKV